MEREKTSSLQQHIPGAGDIPMFELGSYVIVRIIHTNLGKKEDHQIHGVPHLHKMRVLDHLHKLSQAHTGTECPLAPDSSSGFYLRSINLRFSTFLNVLTN